MVTLPAPMPTVGIVSFCSTSRAASAETISSTTAKHPASCTARASRRSCAAASPRPWIRKPPRACSDCGVKPMCPITGMPARTTAATCPARASPASSFTAWAPVSRITRTALRTACSGDSS